MKPEKATEGLDLHLHGSKAYFYDEPLIGNGEINMNEVKVEGEPSS